jgi:3-methyladenine DNA glycosylase AlkD
MNSIDVRETLRAGSDPERAVLMQQFFKTGPHQYGAGDLFWGLAMPQLRVIVNQFRTLDPDEAALLVQDPVHECRMAGLLIWQAQVSVRTNDSIRQDRLERYLAHRQYVNNWDLVDTTAPTLVGQCLFLTKQDRAVLYELAREDDLWSQRIALISTLAFIRKNEFADTFALAELLLLHRHDLIHKAIGWMLREVGKRNPEALEEFLHDHIRAMPRTALRYAIERMEPSRRQYFLTR